MFSENIVRINCLVIYSVNLAISLNCKENKSITYIQVACVSTNLKGHAIIIMYLGITEKLLKI